MIPQQVLVNNTACVARHEQSRRGNGCAWLRVGAKTSAPASARPPAKSRARRRARATPEAMMEVERDAAQGTGMVVISFSTEMFG